MFAVSFAIDLRVIQESENGSIKCKLPRFKEFFALGLFSVFAYNIMY